LFGALYFYMLTYPVPKKHTMKKQVSLTLFALGLVTLFFSCKKQEELPNTPADVLKAYQAFYDENDFEQAGLLATPAEQKRLQDLAKMLAMESADSTVLKTAFLSMNCRVKADSAFCKCRLKDQYETYEEEYVLLRIKKQWLVDAPRAKKEPDFIDLPAGIDSTLEMLDVE
jgi:hypothetical protein